MVPNRRLEYGFRGYQVPATPRAPRSVRRRGSIAKKVENLQAFDLLAAVAGELLLEKDGCPTSNASSSLQKDQNVINADPPQLELHAEVECNRSIEHELPNDHGSANKRSPQFKIEKELKPQGKLFKCKLDDEVKIENRGEPLVSVPLSTDIDMHSVENTVVCSAKKPISSESSDQMSEDHSPCNCFPPIREDASVVSRDDDENLYDDVNTTMKKPPFNSAPRIGDRRIRKILASKYWKVASRVKDEPFSKHVDGDMTPAYWIRKNGYKHQRNHHRIYPFKKKRIHDMNNGSKYDEKIRSVDGATRQFPSKGSHRSLYRQRDSHVKLRIKSFRIPELLVEIVETSTVGSLKRMVMEAVRALFGGGLHVGVVLQGKKVRDDSKTLLQTGITHGNLYQEDSLGFTLEPDSSIAPVTNPQATPKVVHCDELKPLTRYVPDSVVPELVSEALLHHYHHQGGVNSPEIDGGKALVVPPPHPCMEMEKCAMMMDRKALVTLPTTVNKEITKSKRVDIGQRRVRTPFTVSEVEALVQAVEKLGTGRWRDVKVQAFNDAEHRTYVDLKDKWKTLVHTARIAPQQRRGEPVPQQLLDRVLTAQSYWTVQQTKQQHPPPSGTSSSARKEFSFTC